MNEKRYRAKADEVGLDVVCRITRSDKDGTSEPADSKAVTVDTG